MSSNEQSTSPQQNNRHSIISLVLGIITLVVFCSGILIPIPFASLICIPISSLVSITTLIYGLVSLHQIKKHNQTGHHMAWTGILIGGFVLFCLLCTIAGIASLLYFAPETLNHFPIPPAIQNF